MEEVYRLTRKAALSCASVLLLGETGTGKELIATALHRLSGRCNGPFVRVNCGALSENLLESELFGHVRGAFTGAVNNRTGRFEAAHTGTIFLDEIDSTSSKLQVKLLRVLQEREFERVGDTQTIRVDVRVIAASNRELKAEVIAGRFREDLYWRLHVIPIHLPPLRERPDDIASLVAHFVRGYSQRHNRDVLGVDPQALAILQAYPWPGNVRELQNYVERAVVLCDDELLTIADLPREVLQPDASWRNGQAPAQDLGELVRQFVGQGIREAPPNAEDLHEQVVGRVERELLVQVLASCNQTQTKAATRLGINRNTLHKKMKEFGLGE